MSLNSAAAHAGPHPDRLRSQTAQAQHAALSRLGLAGPGAETTPATATDFRDTP